MPAKSLASPVPVKAPRGRPRKLATGSAAGVHAPNAAPTLSPERILEAALALIDRQGLEAFNIRELAQALNVFPSAIYWHVPSRNALVSGAMALAMNGVADDLGLGRWQDRLRALLHRYRDMLHAHPRLAPLVASQLIANSDFDATLLDHIVQLLEDAGFEGVPLVDAYNVVFAAMCGFATMELSSVPTDDADAWKDSCRTQIAGVDKLSHPALARHLPDLQNRAFVLRWTSGAEQPLASAFEVWVDVILAGLEARVRALRRSVKS